MEGSTWNILRWLGAGLAAVSFALVVIARIQLGRLFSVKAPPKGLVTTGLYSRLRHPTYLFVSLFILGLGLFLGSPYVLVILLVLVPAQLIRARREERLMQQRFGSAYLEYRSKTWF